MVGLFGDVVSKIAKAIDFLPNPISLNLFSFEQSNCDSNWPTILCITEQANYASWFLVNKSINQVKPNPKAVLALVVRRLLMFFVSELKRHSRSISNVGAFLFLSLIFNPCFGLGYPCGLNPYCRGQGVGRRDCRTKRWFVLVRRKKQLFRC